MSIFISNSAYLASADSSDDTPIIAWHSVLQIGDITASGSAELRTPSNMWSPDTASFWQANSSGASLTLANPNGVEVDYIAFAKHNLASANITYRLFVSDDGSTYLPLGPLRTLLDDSPVIEFFNPSNKAFFQIQFGDGIPIIAHVRLGRALVLPHSIYVGHAPANISPVVERVSQLSRNGQYLGQIITCTSFKSSLKQENISPAFVREKIAPFIAHAHGTARDDGTVSGTFFFAWRPVDYPLEVIYAWTDSDIRPENQRTNGMMSFGFDMGAVA